MVVDELADRAMDEVFHALADATRRDIVARCLSGGLSVSRLADAYPMSFAAVQKHVVVLERAGLVIKQRHGREQLVRTDPEAVARARRALDALERLWRGRVERMDALLGDPADRSNDQADRPENPADRSNDQADRPENPAGHPENPAGPSDRRNDAGIVPAHDTKGRQA